MSLIRPFRAYRPFDGLPTLIASVPYDVINTKEAREMAENNPFSFLHVCRPEIDLPESTNEHSEEVYATGADNLREFIDKSFLTHEDADSLYVYQQRMNDHVQVGLVALCSVREYEQNRIKKHELTRKDKEDDRLRHVTTQQANAEPVFLTYRSQAAIDEVIGEVRRTEPLYDIISTDGIGHTLWRIAEPEKIAQLVKLFSTVEALYIADGHHRTAAAIRYGQQQRAQNPHPTGDEPYEFFMAVMFPHWQLRIMDYNRVVADLNGLTPEQFLAKVGEKFEVVETSVRQPTQSATFGMYLGTKWYRLQAREGTFAADDPIQSLDVSILQNNLLAPVLGIDDPRTDQRIDFVGGIRGMDELEKRVKEGAAVAFSMYPTSLEQLMSVADAGQIMPPKSTWFEPKLRSGLVVRLYE